MMECQNAIASNERNEPTNEQIDEATIVYNISSASSKSSYAWRYDADRVS